MTHRVGVPVPVVYGGIAAMIALLVAVGYFAGRASSGPVSQGLASAGLASTSPAATAATAAAMTAERSAPEAPPATFGSTAPAPAAAAGSLPAAVASRAAAPPMAAAGAPPALKREVAEYFRKMDAAQSAAKTWSDPNAFAQEVLAQALRGDSGGFDALVASTRTARDAVRAIAAPAPCAEHHRLTLLLLDEAVVVVSKLRDGIASGDTAALASIATSSSALEERAKAVDAMAGVLRAQYGVEAVP